MTESEIRFEKLTPIDNAELGIYEHALDKVFADKEIRNVAISGHYGSGKSSILNTYKKHHSNLKFIHISLAHYESENKNKSESSGTGIDSNSESVLEGKILNQLIHNIPSKSIPQTDFKIKNAFNCKQPIIITVGIMLFLCLGAYFTFFNQITAFINSSSNYVRVLLTPIMWTGTRLIAAVVAAVIFSIFIYFAVKAEMNKNIFRKLSFQGNEIEIFEKNEESYFDKYLNEVLYLFENCGADAVVFEDMDRFEANRIFVRLKEINLLVNTKREVSDNGKPPLRFIYLLRDDIFTSKDRTKFFDFIIPVVPVVDGSNSYDLFREYLENNRILDKFDQGFLSAVSLYVDEMRILKNICNEFLIYYNTLSIDNLTPNYNKLMAMIIYKNLFPKDFNDLQLRQGYVFSIFNAKLELIDDEHDKLDTKIKNNTESIKIIKNEPSQSIKELNHIADGYRYGSLRVQNIDYNKWFEKEYPIRKAALEKGPENEVKRLEKEIEEAKYELAKLTAAPLSQLINNDNLDKLFGKKDIKSKISENSNSNNEQQNSTKKDENDAYINLEDYKDITENNYFDLLKYLIRNGYIDESYPDYMTYFYPNSLSVEDKIFLKSITDRVAKEFTYHLTDPKKVLDRLVPANFDQEETLNFQLIDYILSKSDTDEHIHFFIGQLERTANFGFISEYLSATKFMKNFVIQMNRFWPKFFSEAVVSKSIGTEKIRQYSIDTLYYSSENDILNVNSESALTDYISESEDYLNIDSPEIDKLIKGFGLLNIEFKSIDFDKSDWELFNKIYDNGFYELNSENISLMLSKACMIESKDDIHFKPTELIMKHPESSLYKKYQDNPSKYLEIIFEHCDKVIDDNEETIIAVLNNEKIALDLKAKYIDYITQNISLLKSVDQRDLWKELLMHKRVYASGENILEYYKNVGELNDVLINFINSIDGEINFLEIPDILKEKRKTLFEKLIKCESIKNAQYKAIASNLEPCGIVYNNFNFTNIPDNKMHILIDLRVLKMNESTLRFVRSNYKAIRYYFIVNNIDEYINIIGSAMDQDELVNVLSENIDDSKKIKLLEKSPSNLTISILGKDYPEEVQRYILENRFKTSDMPSLFITFSNFGANVQEIIFKKARTQTSYIIDHISEIDLKLKTKLMLSESVNRSTKMSILIKDLPNIDIAIAKTYLHAVDKDDFAKIFDRNSRPRFENTDDNVNLLKAFEGCGWIDSYKLDDDGYFRVKRTFDRLTAAL